MDEIELDQYLNEKVKSLDLIGFKGKDGISKLIMHLERKAIKNKHIHIAPKISHIGLAIEGRHIQNYQESISKKLFDAIDVNKVYIFESTATGRIIDNVPDVCGKFFFGAQLRELKNVIGNYKGHVYHSGKRFPVNDNQIRKFVEFINEYNHRPYERNFRSLFGNIFRCIDKFENSESVFCSELVTLALQKADVLNRYINPEHVVPLDFYPDPANPDITLDIDKEIPLIYDNLIKLS